MVDQMISSQLGSLNTAAPTGPVWREPKLEQMKEMEEGKKEADELAPMYVEGRTVQIASQPWRQRVPMIVAGVLLLGIAVLLFSQLASEQAAAPAAPSAPAAPAAKGAGEAMAPGPLLAPNATEKASESASEVVPAAAAGTVAANSSNRTNETHETIHQMNQTNQSNQNNQSNQTSDPGRIANYKASCPTLVKLHGACDYDLSVDDKTLPAHTLVRLVCPDECQILDRYQKICPSLLKLEGGCAHDLALEEKTLPQGSFVRLICQECQEESTTAIPTTLASTSTASQEQVSLAPERPEPRDVPPPAETAAVGQTAIKIRPSRWLAYVVSFAATMAWAGLCMQEYGWLRVLGRESG
eukprot:s2532_g10.t1